MWMATTFAAVAHFRYLKCSDCLMPLQAPGICSSPVVESVLISILGLTQPLDLHSACVASLDNIWTCLPCFKNTLKNYLVQVSFAWLCFTNSWFSIYKWANHVSYIVANRFLDNLMSQHLCYQFFSRCGNFLRTNLKHTYLAQGYLWSLRQIPQEEALPMHLVLAAACDCPKCGNSGAKF